MQLNSLCIFRLRNLYSVELALDAHFNVFCGENGGGKTSLLEAVHVLTTGRSFRARQPRQMITFGEESCVISGVVSSRNAENTASPIRLGVERLHTGGIKIRLADQDCQSIALLAKTLPIQLIDSNSYDILEATPQFRRQFLDWAMFHVEHSFYSTWQRFKRALQQRNAALRKDKSIIETSVRIWDKEFVEMGEAIDIQRREILKDFVPIFSEIVNGLLDLKKEITVQYLSGWNAEYSLQEALDRNFERDLAWGYTTVGPQRADLEFLVGNDLVKNVLSRGQLKLFIYALLVARAALLYQRQGRCCIFLIDDLNSELDKRASKLLVQTLSALGAQSLITTVEGMPLANLLKGKEYKMFQVKKGEVF